MEWFVERSPYWEIFGGLEGREEIFVGIDFESLGLEEDCRPPRVDIDSGASSSSGPSSGPESSSKIVFRLAGGGL